MNEAIKDQETRKETTKISSRLRKKIIQEGVGEILQNLHENRICYEYTMSKEKFKGVADLLNGNEPLPGFVQALGTMKLMEEAIFWMSEELLTVSSSSELVITIKVNRVEPAVKNNQSNSEFDETFKETVKNYGKARDFFNSGNFHAAIDMYRKSAEVIKKLSACNDSQELKKKICLKKIYQNWSICCVKISDPHQCREVLVTLYRGIALVKENPKVLYAKARALMMFGKFPEAQKCLKTAEKLSPDDEVIKNSLLELEIISQDVDNSGENFANLESRPSKLNAVTYQNRTIEVASHEEPLKPSISARSMSVPLIIEKSPINVLLELCTAKRFPPPDFTLCGIGIGQPHKPVFIYTCKLLKHQVKGFGSKKKLAKRDAAVKMLEVVNSEK